MDRICNFSSRKVSLIKKARCENNAIYKFEYRYLMDEMQSNEYFYQYQFSFFSRFFFFFIFLSTLNLHSLKLIEKNG